MHRVIKEVGMLCFAFPLLCLLLSTNGNAKDSASTIVDFHPTTFEAKANSKFFYSVGQDLKYSDQIDPHAPTLLHGRVSSFLVSPDGLSIAVVVSRRLMIVKAGSSRREQILRVAPVDSIYKTFRPLGRQFFRDDEFQWSRDSRFLYLVKDEYYRSKGSQLFSRKGELWRYDTESGQRRAIFKPFPASNYFFGPGSLIYFSVPTKSGSLKLKYSDGKQTGTIGTDGSSTVLLGTVKSGLNGFAFYSFSILDYNKAVLPSMGIRFDSESEPGIMELQVKGKTLLRFTQGKGWDGYYFCVESLRSAFLPGNRFLLLNTPFCSNFNGQLLIDVQSGNYQMLPKDTTAYITANTVSYPHFTINGKGIQIN
jgi:hypothetical protein